MKRIIADIDNAFHDFAGPFCRGIKKQGMPSGLALIALLCLTMAGCFPTSMISTDFRDKAGTMHSIGILAPDLDFYDLSVGGIREKRDEWSKQSSRNVAEALSEGLAKQGFAVKVIPREGPLQETADEITSLFTAIFSSYRKHALGSSENLFPHKAGALDYSVGPLDEVFDTHKIDALFLVHGYAEGNSFLMPNSGGSLLWMTLADRNGRLLWLDFSEKKEEIFVFWDLRRAWSAASIIKKKLSDMQDLRKAESATAIVDKNFSDMQEVPK